jgi:arginase family enzyme
VSDWRETNAITLGLSSGLLIFNLLTSLNLQLSFGVHLDVDVLDPGEGRMNQFSVPEGLGVVELEWALAAIAKRVRIQAAALTAFDPAIDITGQAGRAVIRIALALINAVARAEPGTN